MSVLATTSPTLADVAKRLGPDGNVAKIVEILNQINDLFDYIPFLECNDGTSHLTTVRTGIPAPTWRKLYQGVQPVRSTTAQVTDNTGNMENYSRIDKGIADVHPNIAAYRFSEAVPIMQGFSHEFMSNFFYGNEAVNAERFTGLSARYNTRNLSTAKSADNVFHGGGSGSTNTSIWLLVMSDQTLHGLYPKGSQAGIMQRDLGEQTVQITDATTKEVSMYQALVEHFKWTCGLSVRDWRYAVRIANIDVTALTKDFSAGADLIDLMIQAEERIPMMSMGRACWAANRTVRSFLRRQMLNQKNVRLTEENLSGKRVTMFDGIPVCRCDALLNTEATVPNT